MSGDEHTTGGPPHTAKTGSAPPPLKPPATPAYLRVVRGARPADAPPAAGNAYDLDGGEDELDLAEQEIRDLLRQAVGDLQPSPGALQRIQRAVPRRRARRRQAWGGVAAVLLLAAAAVPALRTAVGSDTASHVSATQPVQSLGTAGHAPSRQGGEGSTDRPVPAASGAATPSAGATGRNPGLDSAPPTGRGPGAHPPVQPGTGASDSIRTSAQSAPDAPPCRADQLGAGPAEVAPADAGGTVYGSFTVVNSSTVACTVEGAGTVEVSSAVGTDASRIPVLAHTAGDPATALPPPDGSDVLVLAPGAAYRVRFGWVPDSANATACATTPSSSPSDSASPAAGAGSGTAAAGEGARGAAATDTPQTPQTSVSLSHTPAVGAPSVGPATIPGACSGTVYRTGPLPA